MDTPMVFLSLPSPPRYRYRSLTVETGIERMKMKNTSGHLTGRLIPSNHPPIERASSSRRVGVMLASWNLTLARWRQHLDRSCVTNAEMHVTPSFFRVFEDIEAM